VGQSFVSRFIFLHPYEVRPTRVIVVDGAKEGASNLPLLP
jgi:hypothetical protein